MRKPNGATRIARSALIIIVTILSTNVLTGVPAAVAAGNLAVLNERLACVMPSANNNGRVLGYDSGWSLDAGTYVYHFFGDTFVDRDNNGEVSTGDFETGTVARTTDHNASDCVDLTYKTDPAQPTKYAVGAIPPRSGGGPANECLTWPESGIKRSDGKIFVYYTSVQKQNCGNANETPVYQVGIAEMTDQTNMNFTRRGMLWTGTDQKYSAPLKIGTDVYTFGYNATKQLKIARVAENNVTTKSAYTFLSSAWAPDSFSGGFPPSIAFNATLNRFIAVYTCAVGAQICARAAATTGNTEAALRGSWNPTVVLRDCGYAFACGHVGQHPAYAQGSRIYVSTNRHDGGYGTVPPRNTTQYRYWNTLREYDLSMTASRSAKRTLHDAELEFSGTQGSNGWTYKQIGGSPLTYVAASYKWTGTAASDIFADAFRSQWGYPIRSKQFPANGTVDMTTDIRTSFFCASVTVIAERVRGTTITTLWTRTLTAGWYAGPGAVVRHSTSVSANDKIRFRVATLVSKSCPNNETIFYTSITYDRT